MASEMRLCLAVAMHMERRVKFVGFEELKF